MGLQADLTVKLDVSGPQATFTADLSGLLDMFGGIDLPLDPSSVEGIVSIAGNLDLSNLDVSAEGLAKQILNLGGQLPVAGDLLGTITNILDLTDQFAAADLDTVVTGMIDRLSVELDNLDGGPLGAFTRVGAVLNNAPEINVLKDLYGIFVRNGAPSLSEITLPEILPASVAAVQTLGVMMNLEARLAKAERAALSANGRLDLNALQEREAALRAQLDALTTIVSETDVANLAAVEETARAVAKVHLDLQAFLRDMAEAIAFADSTIGYLDFPRLVTDVQALLGEIRAQDLSIIERAIAELAGKLGPVLTIDLSRAPKFTLDALLSEVESQASALATKINEADLSGLTAVLETGLAEVTRVPGDIATKIEDVKLAVSSALRQVSDAVKAVPLDSAAAAIRNGTDAIGGVLGEITNVLGSIEAALGTAVDALQSALDEAEDTVNTFADAIEVAFADAAIFVDELNLDQVSGQIADGINDFAATIAKADLAPHFATATSAIDTAADVVEKVPFSLLPDSMEEEVVAVARPIKQTDLNAFRLEVQGVLQIGDDGTFTLRPDLEAGVAAIQAKMDALLAAVREHDPKTLAAALEPALAELAAAIGSVAPQINLSPVRQALDQAKAAVTGIDPVAALQPANQAFDSIIAKIDEFSPGALLAGVDTRIDEVREKIVGAIKLREWRTRLEELQERLLGFIALLDLTTLEDDIDRAMQELRRRIESSEGLRAFDGFGAIIAALLAGGRSAPAHAFSAVADWLWGSSAHAHLESHAAAANDALVSLGTTLAALDPQALAARLTPGLSRLNTAVAAKADGPGKDRLEAALNVADPIGMLVLVGANRSRATARLTVALPASGALRDLSFAEADTASTRLRSALAPFAVIPQLLTSITGIVGIPPAALSKGLSGILLALLDSAPPARLASMLTPVYVALRGRLEELLASMLNPLREGIDGLIAAVDAIDIGTLRADLDEIHASARNEIAAFKPALLLAEPLAAFDAIQTAFADFDPLGALDNALKAAEESVLRVLARLDPVKLVESPQLIFDEILGALEQLDVGKLLAPIFDQLDAIAGQIDAGLEGTVGSFKRLQDALPDRIGSTSLSASVSVSVN